MTVDEAQALARLKQEIPVSDRSLHEQALVTILTAYAAQAAVVQAAIRWSCVTPKDRYVPFDTELHEAVAAYHAMSGTENTTHE